MISDSYITKPKKNESRFTTYIHIHILIFCSTEIHCLTVGKEKSGSKSPKKKEIQTVHMNHIDNGETLTIVRMVGFY